MIKYRASFQCGVKIEVVEIESESKNLVFLPKTSNQPKLTEARRGKHHGYFITWDAAHEFLLEATESELISARHQLNLAQSRHGNAKGLKRPQ